MAIRWTAAESSFARSTRLTIPANRHGNAIGHASGSMRYSIVEYCTPAASSYKLLRALDSTGYRGGSFRRLLPWSTTWRVVSWQAACCVTRAINIYASATPATVLLVASYKPISLRVSHAPMSRALFLSLESNFSFLLSSLKERVSSPPRCTLPRDDDLFAGVRAEIGAKPAGRTLRSRLMLWLLSGEGKDL